MNIWQLINTIYLGSIILLMKIVKYFFQKRCKFPKCTSDDLTSADYCINHGCDYRGCNNTATINSKGKIVYIICPQHYHVYNIKQNC